MATHSHIRDSRYSMTKLSAAEEDAISKLLDRTQELIKLDKLDEAEKFLDEILKYKPDEINVPFQRGTLFAKKGEHEKSLEQFLIVEKRVPEHFENLNNIGSAYSHQKKYDDAIFYYTKALNIKPDKDYIMLAMAVSFFRMGKMNDSISCFRNVLKISPDMQGARGGLMLVMIFSEAVSPEELTEEAKEFGKRLERKFEITSQFSNKKSEDRKLRIGYISPDFRDHPVSYFLEPLLRNHSKDKFEIYAYSNTLFDNPVMDRIKEHVEFWRDIRTYSDEKIYDAILEDRIDILIDVTGHTTMNSLSVFARKPAPIQATWLGYPATTGMKSIDYRITDIYADPPGLTEHLNTETLWRLPHTFCCYQPIANSPQVIDHPPYEDNGFITFGCFNNFIKVGDSVLQAWAEILTAVPNARLLLEIDAIEDPKLLKIIQDRLKNQSIDLTRVTLEPRKRSNQFVLYNKIDIALDPFPCNGGTTSMDTLWMGVPLITLAGRDFASRMGVSILTNTGLPDLIGQNTKEYINKAVELANNKAKLKETRHKLREKFANSPAMDHKAFACDMEEAYRGMWKKYCDSN